MGNTESQRPASFFSLGRWPSAIVAIEIWAEVLPLSSGIDYYTSPEAVTHYGQLPLEGGRGSNIGAKWGETDEVCR